MPYDPSTYVPPQIPPPDRHIRRDGDSYGVQFLTFLPQGQAWPREPGSTLVNACTGLAYTYGYVDDRAATLLEIDSDPRKARDVTLANGEPDGLLDEWERAWGLPDKCFADPQSIEQRRLILVKWMTLLGAQSRDWFKEVASWLHYTIEIDEYAPWMCGISRCGLTLDDSGQQRWRIGPAEQRFYWTIHAHDARLTWFRCGAGQCGVDPHLRIGFFDDLECLLRRWKPAMTEIVFDYSSLVTGGSMAGTP